jgi:hypothetical protein
VAGEPCHEGPSTQAWVRLEARGPLRTPMRDRGCWWGQDRPASAPAAKAALPWAMVPEVAGQVVEGRPVLPSVYSYIYICLTSVGSHSP